MLVIAGLLGPGQRLRHIAVVTAGLEVAVERVAGVLAAAGGTQTAGLVEPALQEWEDHGGVADDDCDEGFADGPLAGFGWLGSADLEEKMVSFNR